MAGTSSTAPSKEDSEIIFKSFSGFPHNVLILFECAVGQYGASIYQRGNQALSATFRVKSRAANANYKAFNRALEELTLIS